jgi:hypothetical protein
MGKSRKKKKTDSFQSEVRWRFGPLAAEWGMAGPVEDHIVIPTMTYQLDTLRYRWMYDDWERYIVVHIWIDGDGGLYIIALDDLVVGAKLGMPQHVRGGAQTWLALQQAVDSHTTWLERLHPRLAGPDGPAFIHGAGAKHTAKPSSSQ